MPVVVESDRTRHHLASVLFCHLDNRQSLAVQELLLALYVLVTVDSWFCSLTLNPVLILTLIFGFCN